MDRSDLYSIGWLIILYVYLLAISSLVPEGPARNIAGMMGIFIMVGGIFAQDILFMYATNPYPYIRAQLQPSGTNVRMFIKDFKTQKVSPTRWTTTLILKWPVKLKFYGKLSEVIINHEYPWAKRVRFRPGVANYLGYTVNHPNTEFMVLYEFPLGSFDMDHSNPRPVFKLKEASGDYFLPPLPLSLALKESSNPGELPLLLKQSKRIDELEAALAEAQRSKLEWHSRAIRDEEVISQQENELRGLLESKGDFMGSVVQYMLSLREDQLTIENALRKYHRPTLSFNKWLAITVISLGSLIFAWAIKDQLGGFGVWLGQPMNMLLALGVVVIFCLALYYLLLEKKGR